MSAARGERVGVRWVLVWGLFDVVAAALVATLVFRVWGVFGEYDSKPPVCVAAGGSVVSCALTPTVLMLPAFGLTLCVLVTWQVLRRRSRRP